MAQAVKQPTAEETLFVDIVSERQVLCALINDRTKIPIVAAEIDGGDFADEAYGKLFNFIVLEYAAGKPVWDGQWLLTQIPSLAITDNPTAFLYAILARSKGHAEDVIYYVKEVKKQSARRHLDWVRLRFNIAIADLTRDPWDILAGIKNDLSRMDRCDFDEVVDLGQALAESAEEIAAEANSDDDIGIYSGITALDEQSGPMKKGEVLIIAGRPGFGKTSLAQQVSNYNAIQNRSTLFISLEMGRKELAARRLCQRSKASLAMARRGKLSQDKLQRISEVAKEDAHLPIRIWAPSKATISMIEAVAESENSRKKLDLIVLDYLTLTERDKDQRNLDSRELYTVVSKRLKQLAKKLDCTVIALSQLNRDAEKMPPQLGHLRETGAIEQDADVVWLVDDPGKRAASSENPSDRRHTGNRMPNCTTRSDGAREVTVIVAKHRHGATCTVPLLFYGQAQRFADIPIESRSNYSPEFATYNGQ